MPEDKYKKRKESLHEKKKRARAIREGKGVQKNYDEKGKLKSESTHRMGDDIIGNKTGVYHVFPTIRPKSKNNYVKQSPKEAEDRGEMFTFKNKKKAKKFAYGSWKKGKDKRDAMKEYRKSK
jgi:hypothetical protein